MNVGVPRGGRVSAEHWGHESRAPALFLRAQGPEARLPGRAQQGRVQAPRRGWFGPLCVREVGLHKIEKALC
eukprot:7882639-Lingulodinium_polyedra.AAC.1